MQTLYLFDNFDEPKGALHLTSALVHTEQVKGDDQISFMTNIEPDKCDRILWHDEQDGCWREFVVKTVKKELGGLFEVVAESSLFEDVYKRQHITLVAAVLMAAQTEPTR